MENRLDKIFELCLLLITVIAAAELQYASTLFQTDLPQLNQIFRWTTIPLFFIITFWLFLMIFPSLSVKLGGLENYVNKNVGKAFCWVLFGNFFVLLIITFWALSFSADVRATALTGEWATTMVYPLTLYITWNYLKANFYEMRKLSWKMVAFVSGIHLILYATSYLTIYAILGYSILLPNP